MVLEKAFKGEQFMTHALYIVVLVSSNDYVFPSVLFLEDCDQFQDFRVLSTLNPGREKEIMFRECRWG